MRDFYAEYRENMIMTMQQSLRQIRNRLDIGVQEFGAYLGLTRQSVNNLENCKKGRMSASQYLAVAALLDLYFKKHPEAYDNVIQILRSNDVSVIHNSFSCIEMHSLTAKWFLAFPGKEPLSVGETGFFAISDIEELARSYTVFFDESPFIVDGGKVAIGNIEKALRQEKQKIFMPVRAAEHLQERSNDSGDPLHCSAREAVKLIMEMQGKGSLELRGEPTDISAAHTLQWVFTKFRVFHRLALLTAEQGVAAEINKLNQSDDGFKIMLLKFEEDGSIRNWRPEELIVEETAGVKTEDSQEPAPMDEEEPDVLPELEGWGHV